MTVGQFRTAVWRHYRLHGRHTLPWRRSHNPYRILVSEIMLQQTQVDRVVPFYRAFLREFPTVKALATSSLGDVLKAWQGLGYNRRAKFLHEAAKAIVREHGGRVPKDAATLATLPGIGPYTACAIAVFSTNADDIPIETNIRTAVIYHFFPRRKVVTDAELLTVLTKVHPKGRAREWYAALMDYGAFLKREGVRVNAKSAGYTKQKTFMGSARQTRGIILKALTEGPHQKKVLASLLPRERREQIEPSLRKLASEGLVVKRGTEYRLP